MSSTRPISQREPAVREGQAEASATNSSEREAVRFASSTWPAPSSQRACSAARAAPPRPAAARAPPPASARALRGPQPERPRHRCYRRRCGHPPRQKVLQAPVARTVSLGWWTDRAARSLCGRVSVPPPHPPPPPAQQPRQFFRAAAQRQITASMPAARRSPHSGSVVRASAPPDRRAARSGGYAHSAARPASQSRPQNRHKTLKRRTQQVVEHRHRLLIRGLVERVGSGTEAPRPPSPAAKSPSNEVFGSPPSCRTGPRWPTPITRIRSAHSTARSAAGSGGRPGRARTARRPRPSAPRLAPRHLRWYHQGHRHMVPAAPLQLAACEHLRERRPAGVPGADEEQVVGGGGRRVAAGRIGHR